MNKLDEKINSVRNMLVKTNEYRDFIKLQAAIDQSDFVKIEEKLKEMQKEMTIALDENKMELHLKIADEYKKIKQEFDEHPLYINYINAKRTLNELIQEMVNILKF